MRSFSTVYADLISPNDVWPDFPSDPGNTVEPSVFDLLGPIGLLIGGVVLILVIVSLFMIFKSKEK